MKLWIRVCIITHLDNCVSLINEKRQTAHIWLNWEFPKKNKRSKLRQQIFSNIDESATKPKMWILYLPQTQKTVNEQHTSGKIIAFTSKSTVFMLNNHVNEKSFPGDHKFMYFECWSTQLLSLTHNADKKRENSTINLHWNKINEVQFQNTSKTNN